MFKFGDLTREIHRRSLWQVLGAYLAVGWIALQVIEVLMGTIGLPAWVPVVTLIILLFGLPIVLATAFIQEGFRRRSESRDSDADPWGQAGEPEAAARPGEGPDHAAVREEAAHHKLFTWRNALVAGVMAFALMGAGTAAYMAMRSMGIGPAGTLVAKGVLAQRAPIVLADFQSSSGDQQLARVATEAIRVDLSRSEVVRLVEPSYVREALGRMQRPADARLDLELATELAVREGITAVIGGEINQAGRGFVLTGQVVAADGGDVLVSERTSAADSSKIISAIDKLSKRLRERMGESLKKTNTDEPLERVTTPSLEALRKYSQAVEAVEKDGDDARGIALLEEAVALDTSFAMAYRKLGVVYGNLQQQRARQVEVLTKAYNHSDRLTERERYLTSASYYMTVVNDQSRAIAAYESLLELDPDEDRALNNLGVIYSQIGDHPRAEEYYRRSIEKDSTDVLPYGNAAIEQMAQGQIVEARATVAEGLRRAPGHVSLTQVKANLESLDGDYEAAEATFAGLAESQRGNPFAVLAAQGGLASVAVLQGQLSRAEDIAGQVVGTLERTGATAQLYNTITGVAQVELAVLGDTASALSRIEQLQERYPLDELDPLDRPYLALAVAFATAGEPDRALAILAEYEREIPTEVRPFFDQIFAEVARAAVAQAEGRYEEALGIFRSVDNAGCDVCFMPSIAQTLELAGQPDSALAVYQEYVDTPWPFKLQFDQVFLPVAYERLGQLYDERGELDRAVEYYAKFTELWASADPVLQARVQAAQSRLQAILDQRG
jgi:tetratricopeptide (TPR) repeat protein/TolB-like protein